MEPPTMQLAPPAVSSLRGQGATAMARTISQDIREEREELREAAEQTLNAIVDLNLDGTIKWASPSWTDVVGTPHEKLQGTHMSDLLISENKNIFTDVVDSMKKDDSKSHRVRFVVQLGPLSKLRSLEPIGFENTEQEPQTVDLEAQGIMVYDSASGGESHTMWMIRPWVPPQEIQIDLPDVIVDSLGSGAEVLAIFLNKLTEYAGDDLDANVRPPPAVLCRICERQIQAWWFEKHTDLCLQEHRAEMDVQMAQESLTEHRHAIVKVLDALEARQSRSLGAEQPSLPKAEYKGMPIGPPPSTQSSPGTSLARSRERSGGFGHARARSFAIRRPQARIVELLMDLCDTAIEVSTPSLKEPLTQESSDDLRTQSPQSESRISQVLQWQSPSTNTLEQEQGLAHLCADTEKVAKAKVDAVFRHRKIIEYAERIRIELAMLVQQCINEAMAKADRIAAGQLSDSTESEAEGQRHDEGLGMDQDAEEAPASVDDTLTEPKIGRLEDREIARGRREEEVVGDRTLSSPSALAAALRQVDLSSGSRVSRPTSFVASTRSSSPRECATPRSHVAGTGSQPRDTPREPSILSESETAESEGSMRSSSIASRAATRTESPISEFGDLRRAASSRQHHRRSLILPGASSPRRQESPSRPAAPPSPLRIKARGLSNPHDGIGSPEGSPMLPSSDLSSPIIHPGRHHRRQSSAAISDFVMKPPPSPRLGGSNQPPPQARSTQPSIKDFEIIKPISKGAFGSVYLSKKKSTGEYFAIKVLKKADMVAKNQVGNVKAERAILMWQGTSEFVAKLYWTFSSKDYLYLVMEYMNGGDCASLIKVLGGLPEDWAKKYLGEVVLGVEHLHSRGIIHRDLKPDNLLIDPKGHLKLTDFGLSRMGLVGRQKRALNSGQADATPDLFRQGPFARSTSIASSRSTSLDLHGHAHSPSNTPHMTPDVANLGQPSYFSLGSFHQEPRRVSNGQRSDSGGSESMTHMLSALSLMDGDAASQAMGSRSAVDDELVIHGSPELAATHSSARASVDAHNRNSTTQTNMMPPPMALFDPEDTNRRFVGTPDYLAPETIKGDKQDETSDWWSVGCILFEFLYGVPPFHAGEAEQVFENILARKVLWPDDDGDCEPVSDEAKDLINKLLCMEPRSRLGSNKEETFSSGGEEIRNHPWFDALNWDTVLEDEAQFVPQPENPEDTEYFDARGAVLQSFAEEMEDQASPHPPSAGGSDYSDRPHDALSRVRSQVNSMNRKLMPLHIPPHVRDHKSRRLSEPVANDDFGTFAFKNLSALGKANKDLIQKLRAEALASQSSKTVTSPGGAGSMPPNMDSSPLLANPVQRTISNAKNRPQSPSGYSHANSSPSRASQPSSPLLVSFVAGQGTEGRRKASSNSSSFSHQSSGSLQPPASALDIPKVSPTLQKAATTISSSPGKNRGSGPPPSALTASPQQAISTPKKGSVSSARSRSLTVGSQEGSPVAADLLHQRNRRSQVFDMSPSSSDTEGDKHNALLRVQRRRQSSRRLSQINFDGSPIFRPLDVLICEDHPVARMVMEKLLEKLRCRTISVPNGSEAVRYSMSEVKFDVIFLEYRLPQINGADVARMIRETKNANSHTPIIAITAYLKELQAPHYFDSLIEKPISSSKLIEVLRGLCHWRPESPGQSAPSSATPSPHPVPSSLRRQNMRLDDSPTSGSSIYAGRLGSSMLSSREDSITSSAFGDSESITTEDMPLVISRKNTEEWETGGLGITEPEAMGGNINEGALPNVPQLTLQRSAPAQMERAPRQPDKAKSRREDSRQVESTESADDEDDELGLGHDRQPRRSNGPLMTKPVLPSSKLGIEMMRANSHESAVGSESTPEAVTQVTTTPAMELDHHDFGSGSTATLTPPSVTSNPSTREDGSSSVDATPRPLGNGGGQRTVDDDEATTPRAFKK